MYKRILVPTDGSALSRKAVRAAVLFAKETGATILALHVMPDPVPDELEAWTHHDPDYPAHRARLFRQFADLFLQFASATAASAGVACETRLVAGGEPYRAIVDTAQAEHCDLVFMASHGVKGDSTGLPGSETLKVLLHGTVPVLVHKPVLHG